MSKRLPKHMRKYGLEKYKAEQIDALYDILGPESPSWKNYPKISNRSEIKRVVDPDDVPALLKDSLYGLEDAHQKGGL